MVREGLVAILFLMSALLQMSLVHSLAYPLFLIPLHLIIGILIFHRLSIETGSVWFILSGLVLPLLGFDPAIWWSYILLAIIGIFLMKKLFTTRSLYALEGFGISMFVLFFVINTVVQWGIMVWSNQRISVFQDLFKDFFFALGFLIVGLYVGFLFSRFIERLANEILVIKK